MIEIQAIINGTTDMHHFEKFMNIEHHRNMDLDTMIKVLAILVNKNHRELIPYFLQKLEDTDARDHLIHMIMVDNDELSKSQVNNAFEPNVLHKILDAMPQKALEMSIVNSRSRVVGSKLKSVRRKRQNEERKRHLGEVEKKTEDDLEEKVRREVLLKENEKVIEKLKKQINEDDIVSDDEDFVSSDAIIADNTVQLDDENLVSKKETVEENLNALKNQLSEKDLMDEVDKILKE
jgi:hypothetical protein